MAAIAVSSTALTAQEVEVPLHQPITSIGAFETANTYRAGTWAMNVGMMQTDPRQSAGTGNQLYFGGMSYSPTDQLTFGFDLSTYQDPSVNPIGGINPNIIVNTADIWAKYQVYKGERLSAAVMGSAGAFIRLEDQLWGGRSEFVGFASVKAPVTFSVSDQFQFHVTPSVSVMPDTVNGAPFYGTFASVGLGASYQANERLAFFGAVDVPVSGNNNIDGTGAYTQHPVWIAGGRYNFTPKGALEAYVTNGVGMTPATGAWSHWPDGDPLMFGLRLIYTPGQKIPASYRGIPNPVTPRQKSLQQDGFTLASADVVEPGTLRTSAWYGTDDAYGVMAGFSPDRDGEVQVIFEQFSTNATAPAALVPTTDLRYMFGPKLRFMDQNNGDPFSLSARVLFGRQISNSGAAGVGVFFAEGVANFQASDRLAITANPKIAAFGNTEIAGFGLGLNYEVFDGLSLIAEVTPVGLSASTPTWGAGLRYDVADTGFAVDLHATNAIGRNGIGSLVAQDDVRFGLTLTKTFDLSGLRN